MEVQQDFKELLELFNEQKVEYLIVGAYALAFHGALRYTGDLDIFLKPEYENANRIIFALEKFGFGSLGLKAEEFIAGDKIIQLGVAPVRIDLLTSLTGISWDEAFSNSVNDYFGNVPVRYIGKNEFILNKRSLGRKKDLADIEAIDIQ